MSETNDQTPEKSENVQVLLAKDVLDHIDAGRLVAAIGFAYLGVHNEADPLLREMDTSIPDEDEQCRDFVLIGSLYGTRHWPDDQEPAVEFRNKELQELLGRSSVCAVCGIGSLVYASAVRYDKLTVNDLQAKGMVGALAPYFSSTELDQIEDYFENTGAGDAEERLEFIMKNIIANNGKFVSPDDEDEDDEYEYEEDDI